MWFVASHALNTHFVTDNLIVGVVHRSLNGVEEVISAKLQDSLLDK